MKPDTRKDKGEEREPTLDGERLQMHELNIPRGKGKGRLQRLISGVSQFLAGMYTGESCAGTPHKERQRKSSSQETED